MSEWGRGRPDPENIVVSVGLLLLEVGGSGEWEWEEEQRCWFCVGSLDVFTLDIFVFNQSGWPSMLEVTYPGQGRKEECHGRRIGEEDGVSWGSGYG